MRRRKILAISLCLIVLAWCAIESRAEVWVEDGIPICTDPGAQAFSRVAGYPEGLYFFTWLDGRNAVDADVYAYAVGGMGGEILGWSANGTPICTTATDQLNPHIVVDGAFGSIVAWRDQRSGSGTGMYAQRVDMNGTVAWTANGLPVVTSPPAAVLEFEDGMIPDGQGGAIMVWRDTRSDAFGDIYAQRIDGNGTPLWTAGGVAVCTASDEQENPRLASDGRGGAIIAWSDERPGSTIRDIYAQRVDASGSVKWIGNGVQICSAANAQSQPVIAADNQGGAIIAWEDARAGAGIYEIYAQRIDLDGSALWTTDGVAVTSTGATSRVPEIVSDGDDGAIIAWNEDGYTIDSDVYAQRVDKYGNMVWTANGVPIRATPEVHNSLRVVEDGDGGAVIAFADTWWGVGPGMYNVYAQRVDASGAVVWQANGVPLVNAPDEQGAPQIASDGAGGVVAVWMDLRAGGEVYHVYAQRIERNGYWGYPAAGDISVRDVPGDQGGFVYLSWDASRLDTWPEEEILNYTVWRAIDPEAAMMLIKNGAALLRSADAFDPEKPGKAIRRQAVAGSAPYYWEHVSTVYAYHADNYGETVETLFDSTAVTDEPHYFQVIAHKQAGEYWVSDPASGYSVDNLAPCPPAALAGEQQHMPESLLLTWDPNTEPDLDGYAVYRGLSEDFVPGTGNLMASPCDTFTVDTGWTYDSGYFYKVSAIDVHGNESPFALLRPTAVTGDNMPSAPLADFLRQNYPNPFNPNTSIEFVLTTAGPVSLRVFDAAGRLVRVIVDESKERGLHRVSWDGRDRRAKPVASGVYFYRIDAPSFTDTRKMVLLR